MPDIPFTKPAETLETAVVDFIDEEPTQPIPAESLQELNTQRIAEAELREAEWKKKEVELAAILDRTLTTMEHKEMFPSELPTCERPTRNILPPKRRQ